MSEDLTGRKLGAYQIVEMIGMGGMATVYKAVQPNMERDVAIKVLPRALSHDPTFVGRFKQEARVIARLEHSRILPVYDYGEEDGIIYLVMRYLNAGTLSERMEQGTIPLPEVARIITQIAEGLDHAHKRGVYHRDVKPSNVLLDESGDAYITDFGIARIAEGTAQFTGSGIVGTPTYISPEQAMGNPVDGRTDVYSLGVVLYQMITGDVPYQAETPMGVVIKHINEPLPLPRTVKPDIPANVEAVLLKSLTKNPDARYQTAGEMAHDLREAAANPAAAAGTMIGIGESHDTMPMSAPDIGSTKKSAPTGVLPPRAVPEQNAPAVAAPAKKRPRWLIPVGGVSALLCMCLCVAVLIQASQNRDNGTVELTPGQEPTNPNRVAEATEDIPALAEPSTEIDLERPTCPPAFETIADFDFSEIPAGIESVGNVSIQAGENGEAVMVMQAEGDEASYMVFEPSIDDASITISFLLPSGAADVGLILRANDNDTGYTGAIWSDGSAVISRNTVSVATATLTTDVFDGARHVMTLRTNGSTITFLVDGEEAASYVDPEPLTAGFIGFGAGSGEVWFDGLLACGLPHGDEPLLSETFDEALSERWSWTNEPTADNWALADGLLRIDAVPGTGVGSGSTPILTMAVPDVLESYTVEVTAHIQAERNQAAGIVLIDRTGDLLASLGYGVRTTSEGDVEGVFFDDWVTFNLDRDAYRAQIAGAGFFVDDIVLRLMVERGGISGAYSYDGGVTWEPAGSWTMAVARIAKVGLFTVGGDDSDLIPAFFNNFTVYNGVLNPQN